MNLDNLNQAAAELSGEWVKLVSTDDPTIDGTVLAFEVRPKTFEGEPVLSRKSGQQRTEWVFTLDTGAETAVKVSLNESGQRAVSKALTAAGCPASVGDRLEIRVSENQPDPRSQATYVARWTAVPAALNVPTPATVTADQF